MRVPGRCRRPGRGVHRITKMPTKPATNSHRPSPHAARAATVSVRVRNLAQLFNSLDASPFWDRDLDAHAASFIEEEFIENPTAEVWHLHVHASEGADLTGDVQPAVEHYYTRMAHSAALELREHLRLGQLALLGGLGIFLFSMGARTILEHVVLHGLSRLLDQGLIILAWLALWHPVETLVYGWVPLYRKRRLYQRLAGIRVTVRMEHAHPQQAPLAPPARANASTTEAPPPSATYNRPSSR